MGNTKKHKVLVLSDLTDSSINLLNSAKKVAQMINGEIEFFHVRKPTMVIAKENQISALRAIKDDHVAIDSQMKAIVSAVSGNPEVQVHHFSSIGNLKNEIADHIKRTKPDMVVVGKKRSITPNFIGDNLVPFILKKFSGQVLVVDNENTLDAQSELRLGLFNLDKHESKFQFMDSLITSSETPIRNFEVAEKTQTPSDKNNLVSENVISYVFEKNDQTLNTISNYMNKSKINLLCVDRASNVTGKKQNLSNSELNNLVQTLKVTMLLSNN